MRRSRRPIYMRNIDSIFNYEGLIEHIVEVELFFKGYKKRMSIDVIRGQKLSVILGMPWLAYHNSEIDWRTGEVQMMRCLNECGNKQRMRQTKPGWQKQKDKDKRSKERRRRIQETNG